MPDSGTKRDKKPRYKLHSDGVLYRYADIRIYGVPVIIREGHILNGRIVIGATGAR